MALDVTVGGASADSYASNAEYTTYAGNLGWTLYGDGRDDDNLRRARQYLDRAYQWHGWKGTDAQALDWPRHSVGFVDGYDVSSTTIPQAIKDAQCELAFLLKGGLDPFATVSTGAIRRKKTKAGPVESETEYGTINETPRIVAIEAMLWPYGDKIGNSARIARG